MIFEKVAKILADYKDMDVSSIQPNTTFEELELDSLDVVEIVMSLEEEFGIEIEADESLRSVKDVTEMVEKLVG